MHKSKKVVLMSLASKIYWFSQYIQFFSSISDVRRFSALRKSSDTSEGEFKLGVRAVPSAKLVCRAGTSDSQVLLDVFWGKLHRPIGALQNKPIILDLGANVGYSCFDFATTFPGSRVIGVELDDENTEIARRNTKIFGERCEIIQAAIWRENGHVTYSKNGAEWGYQIARGKMESDGDLQKVRALSIDTLMQETGLETVDFIKMDIEGAEDDVLDAQAGWLQRTSALNIELHPPATYEKCAKILTQAGFICLPSTRHSDAILAYR